MPELQLAAVVIYARWHIVMYHCSSCGTGDQSKQFDGIEQCVAVNSDNTTAAPTVISKD